MDRFKVVARKSWFGATRPIGEADHPRFQHPNHFVLLFDRSCPAWSLGVSGEWIRRGVSSGRAKPVGVRPSYWEILALHGNQRCIALAVALAIGAIGCSSEREPAETIEGMTPAEYREQMEEGIAPQPLGDPASRPSPSP